MKKCKRIFAVLLAVIMLVGIVPAYAATNTDGLNGSSCPADDFDESVYDVSVGYMDVYTGKVTWPSGGSNSSGTSSSSKQWGTVKRVYVRGTPSASYSNYYTDVPSTIWCYHPIMTLTEGGLLNGYGNHVFGSNDALTKLQVEIILTRLLGNTYNGSYSSSTPAISPTTSSSSPTH